MHPKARIRKFDLGRFTTWLRGPCLTVVGGVWALGGCYAGVELAGARGSGGASGEGMGEGEGEGASGVEAGEGEAAEGEASDGASGMPGEDGAGESGNGDEDEACLEPSVGSTPLRRLTRRQYERTIQDLLGVVGDPEGVLPSDEKVGLFDGNSAAPPDQYAVDSYMSLAEEVATRAVEDLTAILPCDPMVDGEDACADEFIEEFALRAFRRPPTATQVETLRNLYELGYAAKGFAQGISVVIRAALQSPHFLYHVENWTPDITNGLEQIDAFGVASRLSYFLWGSMPDSELLTAAANGDLHDPNMLRAQAERLLADDRARDAIADFHLQWLETEGLFGKEKDTAEFPFYDEALMQAMLRETEAFADEVIRAGDGRLVTMLTASWTMVDTPELATLYGASFDASAPEALQRVELDPTQRVGVLTQAGVLATHGHFDKSSPVHRGLLVRKALLCTEVPPPPPDVNATVPPPDTPETERERLEQHASDPVCAACHRLFDPIGFGFEHYDAVGGFRMLENGEEIDASGNIVGTEDMDGPFEGAIELAQRLAPSRQVHGCVAQQWFRFAVTRSDEADECALAELGQSFFDRGGDIRALLLEIVTSDAFRMRIPPE